MAQVSREEIRGELWPDGTFVDFDQAVNFSIKQIRDVLGDSAERPLYIETVPRRGHRFIAPLSPPPVENFEHQPLVTHEAYDYSQLDVETMKVNAR